MPVVRTSLVQLRLLAVTTAYLSILFLSVSSLHYIDYWLFEIFPELLLSMDATCVWLRKYNKMIDCIKKLTSFSLPGNSSLRMNGEMYQYIAKENMPSSQLTELFFVACIIWFSDYYVPFAEESKKGKVP